MGDNLCSPPPLLVSAQTTNVPQWREAPEEEEGQGRQEDLVSAALFCSQGGRG